MSAAAVAPRPGSYGWPIISISVAPEFGINLTGWAKASQAWLVRSGELSANWTEDRCMQLLIAATKGGGSEWVVLANGWFQRNARYRDEKKDPVSEKHIIDALKGLTRRGLIERKPAPGKIYRYRVAVEKFLDAPEYAAPPAEQDHRLKLVEMPERDPAPSARHVRAETLTYYGKPLKVYNDGDLLIAEERGSATVARCGACETVAVFEMIADEELSYGEEEAKQTEPQVSTPAKTQRKAAKSMPGDCAEEEPSGEGKIARSPGAKNGGGGSRRSRASQAARPPSRPQPAGAAGAPAGSNKEATEKAAEKFGVAVERLKDVHKYLCKWKSAFHYNAPTWWQSAEITHELGEAPVARLDAVMKARRDWVHNKCVLWNGIAKLAKQARESWQADVGLPCPNHPNTLLKPGQICNECDRPVKKRAKPHPPQEKWDQVKAVLAGRLSDRGTVYGNWVKPTQLHSADERTLRIAVDDSAKDWLCSADYPGLVAAAVEEIYGPGYELEYVVEYVVEEEEADG